MKKRNKIASIVLFLAAIVVGFDAQPSWSQFGYLDPGYTQCQINFGTSLGLVGMVSLPNGSLLVGGGGLWSVPSLPSNGTLCPTSPPTLLSNKQYVGMALGLDGKVYANKRFSDLVTIDPTTGIETSVVLHNINGVALALDPLTGDLYVSFGSEIRVVTGLYGPHPNPQINHFTTVNAQLDGLAWSCDGTMLLGAGLSDNVIIQVDRNGNSGVLATLPPGTYPDGIAFGANGTSQEGFFFVNSNNGTVTKIQIAAPHTQQIIASGGQRGDFVSVDRQGNLLLTQDSLDHITRLSTASGGQWVLPGSGLCGDLGCGAKAATTRQEGQDGPCLSGLDANLVLTLSQSACGGCESCATLNQARGTLLNLLNSLDPPRTCLNSLKATLTNLYLSCPCNCPCVLCGCPPNCPGDPSIAKTKFPFGIDLEFYDPVLETFMRKASSP